MPPLARSLSLLAVSLSLVAPFGVTQQNKNMNPNNPQPSHPASINVAGIYTPDAGWKVHYDSVLFLPNGKIMTTDNHQIGRWEQVSNNGVTLFQITISGDGPRAALFSGRGFTSFAGKYELILAARH